MFSRQAGSTPDASISHVTSAGRPPSIEAAEFERCSRQLSLSPGSGLPGRVWASDKPAWVADITADPDDLRAAAVARMGLHGVFGFPIRLDREVFGVIEFFSRKV